MTSSTTVTRMAVTGSISRATASRSLLPTPPSAPCRVRCAVVAGWAVSSRIGSSRWCPARMAPLVRRSSMPQGTAPIGIGPRCWVPHPTRSPNSSGRRPASSPTRHGALPRPLRDLTRLAEKVWIGNATRPARLPIARGAEKGSLPVTPRLHLGSRGGMAVNTSSSALGDLLRKAQRRSSHHGSRGRPARARQSWGRDRSGQRNEPCGGNHGLGSGGLQAGDEGPCCSGNGDRHAGDVVGQPEGPAR